MIYYSILCNLEIPLIYFIRDGVIKRIVIKAGPGKVYKIPETGLEITTAVNQDITKYKQADPVHIWRQMLEIGCPLSYIKDQVINYLKEF